MTVGRRKTSGGIPMLKVAFSMLMALMISACAFGNKIDYQSQPPNLDATTDKQVALGVQEQRPYVLDGDKTPQFVGLLRAAAGIPYGVHTQSGRPLADEFATAISAGLEARKIQVTTVTIPMTDSREQAIKLLRDVGAPRSLLVTVTDWRTEMYINAAVDIGFIADVYDSSGTLLATNTIREQQRLSGNFWAVDPASQMAPKAAILAQQTLAKLLNDPKIVAALK
jgi:hypothetical protein